MHSQQITRQISNTMCSVDAVCQRAGEFALNSRKRSHILNAQPSRNMLHIKISKTNDILHTVRTALDHGQTVNLLSGLLDFGVAAVIAHDGLRGQVVDVFVAPVLKQHRALL